MTIATVRSVATQFIETATPGVLVLKGPWGVGKTYVWNRLVEGLRDRSGLPNYSYVSLFGVGSVAQLQLAIVAKMLSVNMLGEAISAASINENWLQWGIRGAKVLGNFASKAREIPLIKNVTVGLEAIAP